MIKTPKQAREYFKKSGLSYEDVTPQLFFSLVNEVRKELENHSWWAEMKIHERTKRGRPAYNYDSKGLLTDAYIKVDSKYFQEREAISFNRDGFIGFAGWADDTNVQPFISAFVTWCDKNNRTFTETCDKESHVQEYQCQVPVEGQRFGVDKCLKNEIEYLISKGIKTTGCCCDRHVGNEGSRAYIGVEFDCISKMKELGYEAQFNPCRPGDEDSFIPKTVIVGGRS